jgi:hypothetical protein
MYARLSWFVGACIVLGVCAWSSVRGQPPQPLPVEAPPCTHDCREILQMKGVTGGEWYCYKFEVPTGRLVWSNTAPVGGMPVSEGGTQEVTTYFSCDPMCSSDHIPQEAWDMSGGVKGSIGFGNYYCSGD